MTNQLDINKKLILAGLPILIFQFSLLLLVSLNDLITILPGNKKYVFPLFVQNYFSSQDIQKESSFLLQLKKNWYLQSSFLEPQRGEIISSPQFKPRRWIKTEVPTTVLAALVHQKIYPEPTIGLNNMRIPDANEDYSQKHDLDRYSHLPGQRNPWKDPYWFWTRFKIPNYFQGKQVWLHLKGINYRAEIWLNGRLIAGPKEVVGMFGQWSFEVSDVIFFNQNNTLAIKIYPLDFPGLPAEPQLRTFGSFGENGGPTGDIGKNVTMQCSIGWDWIPEIRDRNIGIWQPVMLEAIGPVDIRYPVVITKLRKPNQSQAGRESNYSALLTIKVELHNLERFLIKGVLKAKIKPANFSTDENASIFSLLSLTSDLANRLTNLKDMSSKKVLNLEKEIELAPLETRELILDSKEFPQLFIPEPQLWWPVGLGRPNLYELELAFYLSGKISDRQKIRFGLREIETKVTKISDWVRRDFFINGEPLFLRGGAWVPEMLLRRESNFDWLLKELLLWRQANLNLVRLWGGGVTPAEEFFDLCDELGLLVWHDFWITGDCQATWGKGSRDWPLETKVFLDNARSTVLRLRHHPSLFLWTAGNEGYPRREIYEPLRNKIIADLDGTRPFLPSSGYTEPPEDWGLSLPDNQPSGSYSGGPYWWVNPKDYYELVDRGRDWLFKNEVGLPSLPLLSSLKQFLPDLVSSPDLPFPLNHIWGFHDACEGNGKYSLYDKAIRQRYGEPRSLEDYVWKAQLINAENYRAIFEAVNQSLDRVSGVILWKTNSAWPSVMWQLYDYYLRPNAAYYFTRRACQPLHPQLDLRDLTVWIINHRSEKKPNLLITAELLSFDGQKRWYQEQIIEIDGRTAKKLWPIKLTQPSFLVLRLYSLDLDQKESIYLPHKNHSPSSHFPFSLIDSPKILKFPSKAQPIAENYYWLSPNDNFTVLQHLPKIKIQGEMKEISPSSDPLKKLKSWEIRLHNPTESPAFFIHLTLVDQKDKEIWPIFWEDNFIFLPPGQSKQIKVEGLMSFLEKKKVRCRLEGYNLIPMEISFQP
ncbi:MAG: hypothetical protein N3B16_08380 [Candidatus Aminicenantes bacterium]|nr:hypothetical protein [Candidatus Aminicenantes bacterium]